jgi:endonuclease-3 related protein
VELALENLRSHRLLSPATMRGATLEELESAIRPAGFFRQKAQTLQNTLGFLDERYRGELARMFARPTDALREELLSVRGLGPETVDSILLYAGQHAVFVVDAYVRRVLDRHQVLPATTKYARIREAVEEALVPLVEEDLVAAATEPVPSHAPSAMSMATRSPLAQLYNEMHGLMVAVGKQYCLKSAPLCEKCPLRTYLPSL